MFKGAIHVHSNFSDGEYTLAELREIGLSHGWTFSCMTDHAEALDQARADAYGLECATLSDGAFCFLPGLEFECDERLHILGFGITTLIDSIDPEEVIHHIEQQGGVSVIAHPKDELFPRIEGFKVLPRGIEAWNSKYDGRYAPRPATFDLIARLQRREPGLLAFYGQDLHWRRQHRGLLNQIGASTLSPEEILAALSRGDFAGLKGADVLSSDGRLPEFLLQPIRQGESRLVTIPQGRLRSRRCSIWVLPYQGQSKLDCGASSKASARSSIRGPRVGASWPAALQDGARLPACTRSTSTDFEGT